MSGVLERLRTLLGGAGIERDPDGLPRAAPDSADAIAAVCGLAHEEGWRIRLEGQGTWLAADAPADLALSTRGLVETVSVSPADLVATVPAGAGIDAVRRRLAEAGMWLALDPPGRPERSIGSVVATGTAGPLRLGFGPVRDHILGSTVATGDGRLVRAGARVVKNVAGYDLTKLHVGGFGAFGVITELHLRLRTVPHADQTFTARASRDSLTSAARAIIASGVAPGALELLSPAVAADADWVLAARFVGGDAAVEAGAGALQRSGALSWQRLPAERSGAFWTLAARAAIAGPITIRLGVLADGLDETLDLIADELDEGLISAGAGGGMLRWTGDAAAERLRAVRRAAATREIPMTVERAPWSVRSAVGHFGAYREGAGRLVSGLRETFDPRHSLMIALAGNDDG